MTNHFFQQLQRWYPRRDKQQWVLATLFKIEGPSYRSPGAMMLFNDLGEQFGLLSGGCLEADIQIKAAKVIASGTPMTICYDASDEDDMVFLLGIGCGGVIHIMLQPLSRETNYLDLPELLKALEKRKTSYYHQRIPQLTGPAKPQYLKRKILFFCVRYFGAAFPLRTRTITSYQISLFNSFHSFIIRL